MRLLTAFIGFLLLGVNIAYADNSRFSHLAGNPDLRSASALILDATGNMIYGKDTDKVRSIASITKLMTAMVVLDAGLDLDEQITVTEEDIDTVRGTGSRLAIGATLSRRDMVLLAVMASENRAASALGRTYPGGIEAFVTAMNDKARALGMQHSHFADATGLQTQNLSTARDLAVMISAASKYPLITQASTTQEMVVHPFADEQSLTYHTTNRLLNHEDWQIGLSKTGFINEAGRCLVMKARIGDEDVSIVLLNSFGKLTPFGDSNRLRRWLLAGR